MGRTDLCNVATAIFGPTNLAISLYFEAFFMVFLTFESVTVDLLATAPVIMVGP